ncbi:MAG: hypothetical protein OSJ73_25220 [Lachnospiraceae bacterium]|jgi:hypothetical protein|nr:hypothetical protein [Lachnospiraceae bacterium]
MEWKGINAIFLTEYLDDKRLLAEKKLKLNRLCNFVTTEYRSDLSEVKDKLKEEIAVLEKKIRIFISSLNKQQLQSLLFMSLNMNADV